MSTDIAFSVRPLTGSVGGDQDKDLDGGAFRVHISQALTPLGFANGDLVRLRTSSGFKGYAIAWQAKTLHKSHHVNVHDYLREQYKLSLKDPVFIEKAVDFWKPLKVIVVRPSAHVEDLAKFSSTEELAFWARYALAKQSILLPGRSFAVPRLGVMEQQRGVRLIMTVDSMEPHASEKYAMYFDPVHTKVIVSSDVSSTPKTTPRVLQLKSDGIGGLSGHIATIDRTLAFLTHAAPNLPDPYLLGPTTLLLHGPEGTGKTMLLERIAACPWMEVYRLNSETHPKGQVKGVSDVFEEALENQPSLVLMDNLDKFLEKADSLVSRLRSELARLEGSQVVVAAAARSIYDVDTSLRTTSAFKTEIEFFPPNVRQREDILRQILGPTRAISSINFGFLATRSHGFVGRDIHKLCGLARNRRVQRTYELLDDEQKATIGEILEKTDFITQEDFDAIIDQVQPTVLKESILEVPKVRWTDIAGLDHVRSLLEAITIRPFKYPDLDVKFGGPQSRKGVLLFGPPGCAKTLIAQAVATESNQNFLAVKGSELIKMYVGESERAIRDIFRRARAAKPCIIFFDEIDSIGKSREKTQESGLNVVATLLNEMDGIEALKDVFVIGATNRPDILDSALIRTGRFDAHIHIGLPTLAAREQILEIHTRKRPLAADVDLGVVASETEGSSGADISGLCAVAVELAISDYEKAPENEPLIRMTHFEEALKKHVPHTMKEEAERYEKWRPGMSLSEA